jgi:hypothetical protein
MDLLFFAKHLFAAVFGSGAPIPMHRGAGKFPKVTKPSGDHYTRAEIETAAIPMMISIIRVARARSVAGGPQLAPRRSPICWSLAARPGRDH